MKPQRLEFTLAFSSVFFAVLFAFLDAHAWHVGAAFPDELVELQWLQEFRQGIPLPFAFGTASFYRLVAAFSCAHGGGLSALQIPVLAVFLAESALIFYLGRRWISERAGLWALLANALSAFTLLRLRSLLSYSFLPFELLLLIFLASRARRPWASFAVGFLSSLMLLEYELWALGLGVLIIVACLLPEGEKPSLKNFLMGLGLGCIAVLILSVPELPSYFAVRQSQSISGTGSAMIKALVGGLKGYWMGAESLPYTGVRNWPAFPLWAFAALGLGAWKLPKDRRWILLWAAIGMLPLLSKDSAFEPQRAILAWPALCLIAGAGAAWLASQKPWMPAALALLACAGALFELQAFEASMHQAYAPVYGASASVLEIGQELWPSGAPQAPIEILTEFDNESCAQWKFLLPQSKILKEAEAGRRLALLPREYCLKKNNLKGTWLSVPQVGPCLLEPDAATWKRLQAVDASLGPLWRGLPRFDLFQRRSLALKYYLAHPQADVWIKTACLEQVFGSSFLLGELPLDLLKKVEKEPLASASLLLWCANKLQNQDPAWSGRLLKRAAELDPGRVRL